MLSQLFVVLSNLAHDKRGVTAVEYMIMLILIALAVATAIGLATNAIGTWWTGVVTFFTANQFNP